MNHTPFFLRQLGLDSSADARAIRRAYAQKLKLIDQETQAKDFQVLREAYDAALVWIESAQQQDAPDRWEASVSREADQQPLPGPDAAAESDSVNAPAPDLPPDRVRPLPMDAAPPREHAPPPYQAPPSTRAPAEPIHLETEHLGRASRKANEILRALKERLISHPPRSIDQAREYLDEALGDASLVDIDARFIFESGIVALLAGGWRPGHEFLFEAAVTRFEWLPNRSHLHRFDDAGRVIDDAISELQMHERQRAWRRRRQRGLLARLRLNIHPGILTLRRLHLVDQLNLIYPTWLRVVSNAHNIERWRALQLQPGWTRLLYVGTRSLAERQKPRVKLTAWQFFWRCSLFVSAVKAAYLILAFVWGMNSTTPAPPNPAREQRMEQARQARERMLEQARQELEAHKATMSQASGSKSAP